MEEEEPEDDDDEVVTNNRGGGASHPASRASVNAPRHLLEGGEEREGGDDDVGTIAGMRAGGSGMVNTVIAERESAYQAKGRRNQMVRGWVCLLGGRVATVILRRERYLARGGVCEDLLRWDVGGERFFP